MTLRGLLYFFGRLFGDISAIRRGRVGRRVAGRVVGRGFGRLMRRLFK